jgi:hypothetical protein
MTYAEKRYAKAKSMVQYAEEGFKASVASAADALKECSVDAIPVLIDEIKLLYEVVLDAREELKYAEDFLKRSEEKDGTCV